MKKFKASEHIANVGNMILMSTLKSIKWGKMKTKTLLVYYKSENVEGNIDITTENIKPNFTGEELVAKIKDVIREANGWGNEQKIIIANIINLTSMLKELR